MSRQLDLVIQGVLGTNPAVTRTAGGRPYCYFRLATSPSFRTADGWQDGDTIWFTAKSWGPLAENLGRSLHKGDPVVLVGRFSQENWSKGTEQFTTNVLTVSCGGHDLTRGESRFMRIVHSANTAEAGDAGTGEESAATTSAGSADTAGSTAAAGMTDAAAPAASAPAAATSAGSAATGAVAGPDEVIRPTGQNPPPVGPSQSFSAAGSTSGPAADASSFDYTLADEDG